MTFVAPTSRFLRMRLPAQQLSARQLSLAHLAQQQLPIVLLVLALPPPLLLWPWKPSSPRHFHTVPTVRGPSLSPISAPPP